ncbi:MAG: EAL domain-containing protein, partial [Rhodospirillales bacterium]|nr:EAL domain-containing protein [Acetobacter sp.]
VLLSGFVGALAVVIVRATVSSVGSIAAATVLVARGDRSINVAKLMRRDELGAIVESLQAFQDNVARVAFLAHHDALTGLPNRVLFNDRLQSALSQLDRGRDFAVLCLDLDRFKAVNDTLGHPVGDALLRQVADRICACVREGDTVARLGGDEFAIVALDANSNEHASRVADRIVHTLGEPFELDGHTVCIGCSVGIAMAPANGAYADKLLQSADTALYRAKTEGRNTYRFFEASMDEQLQLRRELEVDMRRAIVAQEFELHYQPLVNIKTMQISGFEALMRWRHHERGMISPGDFIAVAEETGLIVTLGEIALMQACRDAVKWPDPIRVSVNLSPVQFKDKNLLTTVFRALSTSGLPPHRLELEVTESVLLHQTEATLAILETLRDRGVRLSMDDFGTGYSSLSYLSSFKFDKIKIDKSFVRDLCESDSSAAIVRAVTGLSGSLGVATTAEGVETQEQFQRLLSEGCTEVQGYLFGPPKPVLEVPLTLAAFGHM